MEEQVAEKLDCKSGSESESAGMLLHWSLLRHELGVTLTTS